MAEFDNDIVKDILRRVVEAAGGNGFNEVLAGQIEEQVRSDWGGSNLYIPRGSVDRITARNEKIQALYDGGQKDHGMLARRFGLSIKQIKRIVGRG